MSIRDLVEGSVTLNKKVLDLGCGDKSKSNGLICELVTTVDAWEKVKPDVLLNIGFQDLPFEDKDFDVVLLIDVIEHLSKERGLFALKEAKRVCNGLIILVTPLVWSDNAVNVANKDLWCYNNPYDYHKSLWTPEDFPEEDGWTRLFDILDEKDNEFYIGVWKHES